jgi:hypothetical protein
MTIRDPLLEEITSYLTRTNEPGRVDVLRVVIAGIAQRVRAEPNWLPSLPAQERQFFEDVMRAGASGPR